MLLVSDVHGAAVALARVAAAGEPVLVLGDLVNLIDYRTNEGIIADVAGEEFVARVVALRTAGDFAAAAGTWREFRRGREAELTQRFSDAMEDAYRKVCAALEGAEAYVTYGNVDRPEMLHRFLPGGARFVDAEVVTIDELRIGFAGGGIGATGLAGEVDEEQMAVKLASLGPVDVLCTHVPPAIAPLATDVVGGRQKGSRAVLDYLERHRPGWHYFGDVHQPQAVTWTVGDTRCRNVGYFRATGRAVRHG
jgi:Icc-related predicted phosphoesterase